MTSGIYKIKLLTYETNNNLVGKYFNARDIYIYKTVFTFHLF